jgi:hypothetical protein
MGTTGYTIEMKRGILLENIAVIETAFCQDLHRYLNEYRDSCPLACRPKWILVE